MKAKVKQLRTELITTKKLNRFALEFMFRIKAVVDSLLPIVNFISEQDHINVIIDILL